MAQSSLVPTKPKPYFSDPAKAREAGAKATGRRAGPTSPEFRDLRIQQIIELKVKGWTKAKIAAHFNISIDTVTRDIARIKRDGLVQKYEQRFLGKLMPLAMAKLVKSLGNDDGDLTDVKEVFKRFDKLSEHKHQREMLAEAAGGAEASLESWYQEYAAKLAAAEQAALPPSGAVDGELVEGQKSEHEFQSEDHTPAGETGLEPGGVSGPAAFGGNGAAQAPPPIGADASQSGVAPDPEATAYVADAGASPTETGLGV